MIDSVQGAEGAIQIGSFYSSFPQLNSPKLEANENFSSTNIRGYPNQSNSQPESGFYSHALKSSSSLCSRTSAPISAGLQQHDTATATFNAFPEDHALRTEDPSRVLKRACSDAESLASNQEEANLMSRSQSSKTLSDHNRILKTLPPLAESGRDGVCFQSESKCRGEKYQIQLATQLYLQKFAGRDCEAVRPR